MSDLTTQAAHHGAIPHPAHLSEEQFAPQADPSETESTTHSGKDDNHNGDLEKLGDTSTKDVAAQDMIAREHDVFAVSEGEDAVNFKSLEW